MPRSTPGQRAKRILIVDDNKDAADTLALLLQFDGHETQAVYSSREAHRAGAVVQARRRAARYRPARDEWL